MKTTIHLEALQFYAYHGYYEIEQRQGNSFTVDVSVSVQSFDTLEDNIEDTVNYEDIYKVCKEEMENTQKLLETVAFKILTRLKRLKNVTGGWIYLRKTRPKIGGDVAASVIEMEF